mgnify:FL=1
MIKNLCKLCQSDKHKILRDTLRYEIKRKVLQCNNCGFVFLEDKNDSSEYYATTTYRAKYGPDLTKTSNPKEVFDTYYPYQGPIVEKIKHLLKPDTSVLDVGCSAGQFLMAIKDLVGKRVGLELSQDEVDFVSLNHDFSVYNDPIEKVKITEGPFDLVTSFQVLEHTLDPVDFVKNLGRQLKPDGYLYLELPNLHDVLIDCYQVLGYANFYYREPHVSYFTKDTLKLLLDQAGFVGEIKTAQRYNIMNHLHWIMTGKPQDNFNMGNGTPKIVIAENVDASLRSELNDFIEKFDNDYKKIIEKYGVGECLTFIGQLKK